MTTLVVRLYEGKELHYTRDGKVQNPNQTVKLSEFDFVNKFLKYCYTLSGLIVLEQAYDAKYVPGGQSKCTPLPKAEFEKFEKMLKDAGVKEITEDPLVEENKKLKAKSDLSDQEVVKMRREMAEIRELLERRPIEAVKASDNPIPAGVPTPVPTPEPNSAQDDFKSVTMKTHLPELIKIASEKGFQLTGAETKADILKLLK